MIVPKQQCSSGTPAAVNQSPAEVVAPIDCITTTSRPRSPASWKAVVPQDRLRQSIRYMSPAAR